MSGRKVVRWVWLWTYDDFDWSLWGLGFGFTLGPVEWSLGVCVGPALMTVGIGADYYGDDPRPTAFRAAHRQLTPTQ